MTHLESTEWQQHAICHNHPDLSPDDFFLESRYEKNSAAYLKAKRRAQAICNLSCKVRDECLAFAMDNDLRDGIWGGLTGPERSELRWPRRHRVTPGEQRTGT